MRAVLTGLRRDAALRLHLADYTTHVVFRCTTDVFLGRFRRRNRIRLFANFFRNGPILSNPKNGLLVGR